MKHPSFCPGKMRHIKLPWDFEIQNGSPNLDQTTRPYNNQQHPQKTGKLAALWTLADYRIKLKESEKNDKYLDLARELKKTVKHENDGDTNCNLCFFGTVTKGLIQGTRGLKK